METSDLQPVRRQRGQPGSVIGIELGTEPLACRLCLQVNSVRIELNLWDTNQCPTKKKHMWELVSVAHGSLHSGEGMQTAETIRYLERLYRSYICRREVRDLSAIATILLQNTTPKQSSVFSPLLRVQVGWSSATGTGLAFKPQLGPGLFHMSLAVLGPVATRGPFSW